MRPDPYKRKTLALFFIVSVVPALVVGAVWYVYTQTSRLNFLFLDFQSFVMPVIMIGVIPAVILSFIFAELLARPIRRIRTAALQLSSGDFSQHFKGNDAPDFEEIGRALDAVAAKLQDTLSQAASETALISAERNKLRGILNSMTDGVFALDHAGRIILFNKAASKLTGRTIAEVAGQLAEKVMPFRSHGELVMTRWLASQPGTEHKVGQWKNLELYRADGSSLYVNVQAVVLNDDPNGIAALVTFHDLTKDQQLEEMKIDFVALAAHELRTPLTEIKGSLDILRHEAKGLSKANRDFLERAATSSAHLGDLIHNLLNVSRIEHGELSFRLQKLDYSAFLRDLEHDLAGHPRRQHRIFNFVIPKSLPPLYADPIALREVLTNLIDNAITHTSPETGKITLTVRPTPEYLETSVADNGSGIPNSAIPHLFTKFFRVGGEMYSTTRGTGLGLFICKSIIEAHGGQIQVNSVEGQGATFIFKIPTKAVAPKHIPRDNQDNIAVIRGPHGWIKDHSIH